MFEILFPLTGSAIDEKALPNVLDMAQLFSGRVHLVRVLGSRRASDRPIDPVDWHMNKLEAEATLARAGANLRAAGVDVIETLLEGNPTEHLVNYARQQGADLVILGSGPERHSFGASAGELLYRSYLTTLLLRMSRQRPSHQLGRPTDKRDAQPFRRGGGLETHQIDDHAFGQHVVSASLSRPLSLRPQAVAGPGSWQAAPMAPGGVASSGPAPLLSPAPSAAVTTAVTGRGQLSALGQQAADQASAASASPDAPRARAPQPAQYKRILAALDGSKRAECVFPWVRQMAERHHAEVILAHVVVEPSLPRLTPPSQQDVDLSRQLIERNRQEAGAYLDDAKSRLGVTAEARILQGHKAAVLLHDLVDQEAVDLVVLSAHGYGGESRWPFGDVATSFIDYGSTPLLLVQDMGRGADQPTDVTAERWAG